MKRHEIMVDRAFIRRQLQDSLPFILGRISAEAFYSNQHDRIRNHPALQTVIGRERQRTGQVTIIAIGKMAPSMATEFVDRFQVTPLQGVVSSPYDSSFNRVEGLKYFRGSHPIPNRDSVAAARTALAMVRHLSADDTVVYLVSGGGSACFELPVPPLQLDEIRTAYEALISCGAGIHEVNSIRQRLSGVKGGRLAAASGTQRGLSLVVSDVAGNDLPFVSSGPSMRRPGFTPADIEQVIGKYSLARHLPKSVTDLLSVPAGDVKDEIDQQLPDAICIGSNADAVAAAAEYCTGLGWQCKVETRCDEHQVADAVISLLQTLSAMQSDGPCCVIAGGEVRCQVTGGGQGGRNQAFVLECLPRIAEGNIAVISFGTDGVDGNSPAAGAFADGSSMRRCREMGISVDDAAQQSDSFRVFSRLGDALVTGPTESNVCDVRILVKY